ncbi:hypothetical protein D3C77_500390 [compost metagenome]
MRHVVNRALVQLRNRIIFICYPIIVQLKFDLYLASWTTFPGIIFTTERVRRNILILGSKFPFGRPFHQLLHTRVQIMRRFPRFVSPEICSGIRNFIKIFFTLLLQYRKSIITRSGMNENAMIALPKINHIRAYAADRPNPDRFIPALINRYKTRNSAFRQHFVDNVRLT